MRIKVPQHWREGDTYCGMSTQYVPEQRAFFGFYGPGATGKLVCYEGDDNVALTRSDYSSSSEPYAYIDALLSVGSELKWMGSDTSINHAVHVSREVASGVALDTGGQCLSSTLSDNNKNYFNQIYFDLKNFSNGGVYSVGGFTGPFRAFKDGTNQPDFISSSIDANGLVTLKYALLPGMENSGLRIDLFVSEGSSGNDDLHWGGDQGYCQDIAKGGYGFRPLEATRSVEPTAANYLLGEFQFTMSEIQYHSADIALCPFNTRQGVYLKNGFYDSLSYDGSGGANGGGSSPYGWVFKSYSGGTLSDLPVSFSADGAECVNVAVAYAVNGVVTAVPDDMIVHMNLSSMVTGTLYDSPGCSGGTTYNPGEQFNPTILKDNTHVAFSFKSATPGINNIHLHSTPSLGFGCWDLNVFGKGLAVYSPKTSVNVGGYTQLKGYCIPANGAIELSIGAGAVLSPPPPCNEPGMWTAYFKDIDGFENGTGGDPFTLRVKQTLAPTQYVDTPFYIQTSLSNGLSITTPVEWGYIYPETVITGNCLETAGIINVMFLSGTGTKTISCVGGQYSIEASQVTSYNPATMGEQWLEIYNSGMTSPQFLKVNVTNPGLRIMSPIVDSLVDNAGSTILRGTCSASSGQTLNLSINGGTAISVGCSAYIWSTPFSGITGFSGVAAATFFTVTITDPNSITVSRQFQKQ